MVQPLIGISPLFLLLVVLFDGCGGAENLTEFPPNLLHHSESGEESGKESKNGGSSYFPFPSDPNPGHSTDPLFLQPPKTLQDLTALIRGIRIEESRKEVSYENKGISVVLADSSAVIRLFGERFTRFSIIRFTTELAHRGADCDDLTSTKSFTLYQTEMTPYTALAKIQLPPLGVDQEFYYICVRENNTDMPWVHQGFEQWVLLKSYENFLPLWSNIAIILVLLVVSGLFSGLNLGLMAIDTTELKILVNTGTDKEKRYAKTIQPLRINGNYLLCSLLLGNVLVNSTLTILLDELMSGGVAIIVSTLGIVVLGEIIPQAFCSRHGLAVGAKTIWLTKFFMAITFPISYPISVILDRVLGEELGNSYNRERLKELIKVTHGYNDLEKEEVNIISGALELKQKKVFDIMTKLEDVFMLPIESILDFETVSEIMAQGFSRIPVYDRNRSNIVSLLYTKDLAFVDPDDKMPLKTICEFYNNPCNYVFENVTLDIIFTVFKQGNKGHLAFIQKVIEADKGDPYYETIGLVTLEDVIEELIQAEIKDETDVWVDNRRRKSKAALVTNRDKPLVKWKTEGIHVSPQLVLASYQYLSTSVEQFNSLAVSSSILQRLLRQNLFFQIKVNNKVMMDSLDTIIYERGKNSDYFVLILEGRVQAEMGKEKLIFESGPFTFFGTQSLNLNIGVGEAPLTPKDTRKFRSNSVKLDSILFTTFIPDYTVRAVTDVTFLRISRSIYMAAKNATLLERTFNYGDPAQNQIIENFEVEIGKMMKTANSKFHLINENIFEMDSRNNITQEMKGEGQHRNQILSEIILTPNDLIRDSEKKEDSKSEDPDNKNTNEDSAEKPDDAVYKF